MVSTIPTKEAIELAAQRIEPFVHRTPVVTSHFLDTLSGARIYLKCENLQKIGAFKIRGATNAALQLSKAEQQKGLTTHSSGNHAQAVALTAKNLGTKAFIVMPENAPAVKKAAVADYGAEIIFCKPTLEAREKTLSEVVKRTGATFLHPYDNPEIIVGQATCAKELLEDTPALDIIMAPVGGGGLLSGTALSAHYFSPATEVIAVEPEGADDAFRSFEAGKIIPSQNPKTIADGLLTSLGTINFPIIQQFVSEIMLVNDVEIVEAMRYLYERVKLVVEPSAAVPLAALLKHPDRFQGKSVGIVLSGGNVDLSKLPF